MHFVSRIVVSVVALLLLAAPLGLVSFFTHADSNEGSWLSASPALTKVVDLPHSQAPSRGDIDCTQLNYVTTTHQTGSDCFISNNLGMMGQYGSPILFNGGAQGVPLTPYGNYSYVNMPIPNQSAVLAGNSAPAMGMYLHMYNNFPFKSSYDQYNNLTYTVYAPPQVDIKDETGKLFPANIYTRSFSSDGSWMVIEDMQNAMLRINLATLDVTPFALSLARSQSDYNTHYAHTAISDDGRYVAIYSHDYNYFRVYDLSTCSGTWTPSFTSPPDCQFRDMLPLVSSQLAGFNNIYSVRFSNDDNINFDATYNYVSGSSYSAARYNLTASGGQLHKIDYLALGDSYISGQGTFVYKDGTDTDINTCHVSPLSYPYIVGADLANSYQSIACSGATTDDIINMSQGYKGQVNDGLTAKDRPMNWILSNFEPGYIRQDSFVSTYQPKVVTLSIGGNDIGFSDILQACVAPQLGENTCFNSYAERRSIAQTIASAYPALQQTYAAILAADPGVQLYVIGYPQIAVQGNCADNVHLDSTEIAFSQQLISYLDSVVSKAATSVGARYVDMENALTGHRLCEAKSSQVAINGITAGNDGGPFGLKVIGGESFHPNVLGHQLLAQAVLRQTDNFHESMPAPDQITTAPGINDSLAQALLQGYQPGPGETGVTTASYNDSLLPDVMLRGTSTILTVDGSDNATMHGQVSTAVLHSSPVTLGTFTTSSDGSLSGQITIPGDTAPGFHTIHLYGRNMAGEQADIFKVIYVAASDTDYNGDGVPNADDQCLTVPLSGHDADEDGIDDACDPVIDESPAINQSYPVMVKLTGNSIQVGN